MTKTALKQTLREDGPQTAEQLATRFGAAPAVIQNTLSTLLFVDKVVTCRIVGGMWVDLPGGGRWKGGQCIYELGNPQALLNVPH